MCARVGTYTYRVESFHLDCRERLSLTVLGNQLLNAATRHADACGYGREALRRQGLAWVFSRLTIQMERYPGEYDEYIIRTWVESASRFFSVRCFAVCDGAGQPLGYATSVWAVMDLTDRKAVAISDVLPHYADALMADDCDIPPCPIERAARQRVTAVEPVHTFAPLFCDMDYNGHFNSIKYIEHLLNALPIESLQQHAVRRLDIAYSTECRYGEPLAIYSSESQPGTFALEIRKADGSVSSRAMVCLDGC